ncbi:hypothetical protein ATANTOWER_010893 [Ataeniobius toweri]|uniref:Uncharacterized protein n=1 Tax=Ataeniobius toweri TaxID=208326 RepID=A0ABU7BPW5_9TELE|nr:hypothetical protein [Ataeniobius toweri]
MEAVPPGPPCFEDLDQEPEAVCHQTLLQEQEAVRPPVLTAGQQQVKVRSWFSCTLGHGAACSAALWRRGAACSAALCTGGVKKTVEFEYIIMKLVDLQAEAGHGAR